MPASEINKIVEEIKDYVKDVTFDEKEKKIDAIKSLLEANANLYQVIRQKPGFHREGLPAITANIAGLTAAAICNLIIHRLGIMLTENEQFAPQFVIEMALPLLQTLVAVGIYKIAREKIQAGTLLKLAEVTRVDIAALLESSPSKELLETINKKLQKEHNLLMECASSQNKDTWLNAIGTAAGVFTASYCKMGYTGAFFTPIIGNVISWASGSDSQNIKDVKSLTNTFQPPRKTL